MFDPYHKWLGITPKEQPPNHYRLLGVDLIESDPDVIAAAADRQMAHLKSHATGPHGALSQKLVKEIAAARLCLLDPQKKAAYDATLKANPSPKVKQPATVEKQAPTASSTKKRPAWLIPVSAVVVIAVVIGGVVLGLRSGSSSPAQKEEEPKQEQVAALTPPGKKQPKDTTTKEPPKQVKSEPEKPKGEPAKPEQEKKTPPSQELPAKTEPKKDNPDNEKPSTEKEKEKPEPVTTENKKEEEKPAPLIPVPGAEAQKKAEALIKEIFKKEYAKAKQPTDKAALAEKLFTQGMETKDDPAARFVLLREARDLAAESGAALTSLKAIDELAKTYEIKPLEMKLEVLTKASKATKSGPLSKQKEVVESALALIEAVIAEDNYEVAFQLGAVALTSAKSDTLLTKKTSMRLKEIQEMKKVFEGTKTFMEVLKKNLDEPEANTAVGKYLCLLKGDWEQGLPMLAKGKDSNWKKLAEKDQAQPSEVSDQVAVGDGWWEMAQKEDSLAKAHMLMRSKYWYDQAAAKVTGLTKAKVDQRLKEIPKITGTTSLAQKTPVASEKKKGPPPKFTDSLGMEFALVPKGKSWLGGGGGKVGAQKVEIPYDFYLGVYEVTQGEWEKVMGNNPSKFKEVRFPVEMVSWDDCQLFIRRLNKQTKETGWVYRLPKEVEWEYACRGGPMQDILDSKYDFYLEKPSKELLSEQANFNQNLKGTCKVGSYKPNKLGLFDMHGNIRELCHDEFKGDLKDVSKKVKVLRGGGWDSGVASNCRAAVRQSVETSYPRYNIGFRLARVPVGAGSK